MRTALAPDPDHALASWLMHDRGGDVGLRAPSWWTDAECAGMAPERFVGEAGQPMSQGARVCQRCDVRDVCLEYALADPELYSHGVFGGKSPAERRAIGKARGLPTSPLEVDKPAPPEAVPRRLVPCGTGAARRRHRSRGETCETCERLLNTDPLRSHQSGAPAGVCACGCGRDHAGPGRVHPACRKRQQRQRAHETAA